MAGLLGGIRINDDRMFEQLHNRELMGDMQDPVVLDTSDKILLKILQKLQSIDKIGKISLMTEMTDEDEGMENF